MSVEKTTETQGQSPQPEPAPRRRGFAAMDAATRSRIATLGGKAAHAKGVAHAFSPEEARDAGRKGGEAVSKDREHMSKIGAAGGRAGKKRDKDNAQPERK